MTYGQKVQQALMKRDKSGDAYSIVVNPQPGDANPELLDVSGYDKDYIIGIDSANREVVVNLATVVSIVIVDH